jgi:Flp pilus assembly protein TadD
MGRLEEATAAARNSIALSPGDVRGYVTLGVSLCRQGKSDEGQGQFRKAIALEPDSAFAYSQLGNELTKQGRVEEAFEPLHKATELQPEIADPYINLGMAFSTAGKPDRAMEAYRKAIELEPDNALAHANLGRVLFHQNMLEEASVAFRRAIAIKPRDPTCHYDLGTLLSELGQSDESIMAYRQAIALNPQFAEAHCNLGHALRRRGDLQEALVYLKRGHELGTRNPQWSYPSALWVGSCEELIELDTSLFSVLTGELKVAEAHTWIALAEVCYCRKRFDLATRFYEEAIGKEPALTNNPNVSYNAACVAALAGNGEDRDVESQSPEQRQLRRRQALAWLRAALTQRAAEATNADSTTRLKITQTLQRWLRNPDLRGLHDEDHLARLTEEEHLECVRLWRDVRALLRHVQPQ